MIEDLVWMDGAVVPAGEAQIPIYDRGFLYGDSVFETLRTYGGTIHALDAHLARLQASAEMIAMPLGAIEAPLRTALDQLLAASGGGERYLRIMVTRGDGAFGLAADLSSDRRTVILSRPLPPRDPDFWTRGVTAITVLHTGHQRREAQPKSGNYLPNILALDRARRAGAHEAIRIDSEGLVTEGSTSNVFIVRANELLTPNIGSGVLPGITRQQLIEARSSDGLPVRQAPIPEAWLREADEIILSSTLREVVGVTELDGVTVGTGRPGPVCRSLHRTYSEGCHGQ
jgi:branched-chain amino acid aminotransferase